MERSLNVESGVCCVVGSGPAGVACATALLARGRRVHLLDGGLALEPERAALVGKFSACKPEQWTREDLEAYRAGMNPDVGGVPLKLVYGSDFAYREADEHLGTRYANVGLRPSLARGGLSTVWGAAMMPYAEADVTDWPLPLSALTPHYEAVVRFTGLAATRDDLAQWFPLHTSEPTELRPSAQAARLLHTLGRNREALARAGIHFGRSRLAVRGNPSGRPDSGCVYCRLCMYGCPYGHIYNSVDTLAELQRYPQFSYQSGVVVRSAREVAGGVEVSGYERQTRKPLTWKVSRVFLAAGTLATTDILLRSLGAYEQTVWLQDSQYFLVPLFLTRRVRGVRREALHALSQVFLEVFDGTGRQKTAHIQLYSHNDLIGQAVGNLLGPLRRPLDLLARNLEERLLVAQGYLHSQYSSRIGVSLKREAHTGKEHLELAGDINPAAKTLVRKLVLRLCRLAPKLGAIPVPLMLKVAEPGRSFHTGGSFPMSRTPRGFQSSVLGCPGACSRVHAVDATVLPSIPATTITLSVMANAHRIGWEAAELV